MAKPSFSRRRMMQAIGATALSPSVAPAAAVSGMGVEGRDTPKLCMGASAAHLDEGSLRRVTQLGVGHVVMGGPPIPWKESLIQSIMDRLKFGGLTLGNMMISGFPKTIV